MKLTVAHFIRKHSQLQSTFIKNQVESHFKFSPVVLYKLSLHKIPGGFAELDSSQIPTLGLSANENKISRLKFKILKLISNKDINCINDFIKKHDVKVLHFHYGTDAGIFKPFLKSNKIPSLVSFYGYDCSGFPRKLGGFGKLYLQKRVFPFTTKVLAMSPDMKKDLISLGCPEEKIIVHHHGNDIKRFFFNRDYKIKTETVNFLILSGLTCQKGHFFLLKSFTEAHKKNNNIRLTIVGGGPLKLKIANYISDNNLSGYVRFESSVVYLSKKHLDYLKNNDIFIHPSITDISGDKEGIPGAIIEAMASGLPVISTYHAGIPYIIENRKTGLLVNEYDYNALTEAILELASNEFLRKQLGQAGQKFVQEELDLLKKEEELENIYLELIKNR
jgi:colanic acid/amylovoran biosynthesis glycosyltransferase